MIAVHPIHLIRRRQLAAIARGGRDGTGVHERHIGNLSLARLGTLAAGEVAGGMADGERAIGGHVARPEARAAKGRAQSGSGFHEPGRGSTLNQRQVLGLAGRIQAQGEHIVSNAGVLQDVGRSHQIFVGAA